MDFGAPTSLRDLSFDARDLGAASDLPYDPDKYFDLRLNCIAVSLEQLAITRARPKGVSSAAGIMRQCLAGKHPKRKPITIEPNEGAPGWIVVDGNSTVLNAWASGWRDIPCNQGEQEAVNHPVSAVAV